MRLSSRLASPLCWACLLAGCAQGDASLPSPSPTAGGAPAPASTEPARITPTSDAHIRALFNASVETRLDTDVTRDGLVDTIVVIRSDDGEMRALQLFAGYSDGTGFSQGLTDGVGLDPGPGRRAELSIEAGELVVTDWAGTPATVVDVLRYRFNPSEGTLDSSSK